MEAQLQALNAKKHKQLIICKRRTVFNWETVLILFYTNYYMNIKMKKKVLLYKNFKGELCIVTVRKLPFWERIIYRKKFDIKFFNSYKKLIF